MSQKIFRYFASLVLALAITFAGFSPALAASPLNDNFSNATIITLLPFSIAVDISGASYESGEPQSCNFMDRTVWYSFTPTENMIIRTDTQGSTFYNTNVSIYHSVGGGISDLQFLTCSFATGTTVFLAEAGETYYLQAGNTYGDVGTIQINLQRVFPPANDTFVNAEAITSIPFSTIVDLSGAGIEDNEPQSCNNMERTVWYRFAPIDNMMVSVDTVGSTVSSNVTIYKSGGPGVSDLQLQTCTGIFQAEVGQTYYLQVGTPPGWIGSVQINLKQVFPPANDNFVDALAITSLPFSDSVDNTWASIESSEPQNCYPSPNTVWYSFTPTANSLVRADMAGSSFSDTILSVYQDGGSGIGSLSFLQCAYYGNSITFNVQAGVTYYFQAGSISNGGDLHLNLQEVPPPANDNFTNAMVITSPLPFNNAVDTSAASVQTDEPTPSCAFNGLGTRSVWYAFKPTKNRTVSASVSSVAFTPVIAAYTGNSLGSLTEVGCQYNGNLLTFSLNAGTTYYLQVGNLYASEQGGSMQFNLDVPPPPVASFYFFPSDPSVFDTIQFYNQSYDPAQLGFQSFEWKFDDGTTSTDQSPIHQYAKDKDYTVKLKVKTLDGRTASFTQTIHVQTHDVSINKFDVSKSTKAGKTEPINITVRNAEVYNETVRVDLYKSIFGGGDEFVSTLTKEIPGSRKGNQTAIYTFNYTFTSSDAAVGKVVFHAIATIENFRDAFPLDNDRLSAPIIVKKK